MKLTKIIQIVAIIVAGLLFFVMRSNVKWGVLALLAVALGAHFWEFIVAQSRVELGKVEEDVRKKLQ
jgi:hypothetical protein